MKSLLVVAAVVLSSGCAHTVKIQSDPPGAEVFIDGQKVGKTPVAYEEKTAGSGPVVLVGKANGKEKKVTVQRDQLAAMPIVAGAAAGTAACLGLSVCGVGIAVGTGGLCAPCGFGVLPSLLLIPAGAGAGWFMWGNQMPDSVTIDMKDAVPAEGTPAGAAPPAAAY